MNVSSLYKKLKQILQDSNVALVNRGLNEVNTLSDIPSEIEKLGSINRLPYLINDEISILTEEDFGNITTIGEYAFSYCNALTNVILSNSITHLNSSAFRACSNLSKVSIGNNVTDIGVYVFYDCYSLTDMYLYPTIPPTLISTSAISKYTTTIHVPVGSGEAYRNATNWSSFADKIVEDIVIG